MLKYQSKDGQILEAPTKFAILNKAHRLGIINDNGAAMMPAKADVKMAKYVADGTLTEVASSAPDTPDFSDWRVCLDHPLHTCKTWEQAHPINRFPQTKADWVAEMH